jgi:hypothetical protein
MENCSVEETSWIASDIFGFHTQTRRLPDFGVERDSLILVFRIDDATSSSQVIEVDRMMWEVSDPIEVSNPITSVTITRVRHRVELYGKIPLRLELCTPANGGNGFLMMNRLREQ